MPENEFLKFLFSSSSLPLLFSLAKGNFSETKKIHIENSLQLSAVQNSDEVVTELPIGKNCKAIFYKTD